MSEASARLVVRQGPYRHQEYPITQVITLIGRGPNNDIVFTDPELSRQHARIMERSEGYFIEDMGSTNGTFLNGERLSGSAPLHDGDTVSFGESIKLEFLNPTAVTPTPDEEDTWGEEPIPAGSSESGAAASPPAAAEAPPAPQEPSDTDGRRRRLLGCGCGFLAFVFVCAALLFFLDAYNNGRLLYCGPLRPLFEIFLGPLGFSPACDLNTALTGVGIFL